MMYPAQLINFTKRGPYFECANILLKGGEHKIGLTQAKIKTRLNFLLIGITHGKEIKLNIIESLTKTYPNFIRVISIVQMMLHL